MSCGSIEVFALRLAINLVIWISLSILFFNIFSRHVPRYARWFGKPFPLRFAVFNGVFGALLYTLIITFVLKLD